MRITRTAIGLFLGLVLLAGSVSPAAAQQKPIVFDARGGWTVPAGDLADVAEAGPSYNVGINFGLTDRFMLRLDGGADLYDGFDIGAPLGNEGVNELEVQHFRLHAGALYYLTRRQPGGFFASVNGTAGFTNLSVPRTQTSVGTDAVEIDISELYPSANVGATAGYSVHEQVDVYLDAQAYGVFGDEADTGDLTQVYNDRNDPDLDGLSTTYSFPVSVGLRLHF
ncbi:MAG: hypothetical protein Q8W44_05595 [Candidatus Palauibacterales bacterium]|nr:hypothetical protein [Candidatus Palauibacterales bacterium]